MSRGMRVDEIIHTVLNIDIAFPLTFGITVHDVGPQPADKPPIMWKEAKWVSFMFSMHPIYDRVTGKETRLLSNLPLSDGMTKEEVLNAVRHHALSMLGHELDECFIFDGARPFDPH